MKKAEFERQKSEVDQTYKFLTAQKQEVERELAHFKKLSEDTKNAIAGVKTTFEQYSKEQKLNGKLAAEWQRNQQELASQTQLLKETGAEITETREALESEKAKFNELQDAVTDGIFLKKTLEKYFDDRGLSKIATPIIQNLMAIYKSQKGRQPTDIPQLFIFEDIKFKDSFRSTKNFTVACFKSRRRGGF